MAVPSPRPGVPRPFRVEHHGIAWIICDANGINWGLGMGNGAVFAADEAEANEICDRWNRLT